MQPSLAPQFFRERGESIPAIRGTEPRKLHCAVVLARFTKMKSADYDSASCAVFVRLCCGVNMATYEIWRGNGPTERRAARLPSLTTVRALSGYGDPLAHLSHQYQLDIGISIDDSSRDNMSRLAGRLSIWSRRRCEMYSSASRISLPLQVRTLFSAASVSWRLCQEELGS